MATIQIFSKDLQDLLVSFKTEENWQLEGLEDVETLTDIIRETGSDEIARAIIQFIKKYGKGSTARAVAELAAFSDSASEGGPPPTQGGLDIEGLYCL